MSPALCLAGERHRLEDQVPQGKNGLEMESLLIGPFIQFLSGNIWVNHPSLELKSTRLPDNRDLGVAERHSHFCDASGSPEHSFNSIEISILWLFQGLFRIIYLRSTRT